MLILDQYKHLFYFHYNKEHHLTFNLPPGYYYSYVPLYQERIFLPYEERRYPDMEADLNAIVLMSHANPNKASTTAKKIRGKIWINADPKYFYHEFLPTQVFTLLHEIFHSNKGYHLTNPKHRANYYIREHTEMRCDDAAENWMLCHGWNPIQISMAGKLLLQGKNRRDCIAKNTTGKHYRR